MLPAISLPKLYKGFQYGFFIFLSIISLSVKAQTGKQTELRMTQQEIIDTKASGPSAPGSSNLSAVQVVVIYGDPAKPGLYTILLKVAANTKIPAHLHPDERVGTVVSGTWYFGYGDKFDESKLKKLPVGSVYAEVAGQNHFAMTGNEPVICEITGYGPSGVTYVNAADDPKNHKN
ncbi:MAG: cupin domain-containing protein [Chitinophagaceae bacterium]